jgi:glycosyltransferase involved in cell wall biosynthesis
MASGVPVVSVAAGGLTDIIEDRKTGLLFPIKDLAKAVELTKSVLDSKQLRDQLSQVNP